MERQALGLEPRWSRVLDGLLAATGEGEGVTRGWQVERSI